MPVNTVQLNGNESEVDLTLVLFSRYLSKLPEKDQVDVVNLITEMTTAESKQEQNQILMALSEIFSQRKVKINRLPMDNGQKPEKLEKWIEYISNKIKQARKERKWTQEDLAQKTGLPQSHISRIEAGKHSPSYLTIEKIAKAFGISAGELDPSLS